MEGCKVVYTHNKRGKSNNICTQSKSGGKKTIKQKTELLSINQCIW